MCKQPNAFFFVFFVKSFSIDDAEISDVKQGALGDCRFLASVGAIVASAQKKLILERIFEPASDNETGVFAGKLFLGGQWKTDIVDQFLVCCATGS